MGARNFDFELHVFTSDANAKTPGPSELLELTKALVTWKRIDRQTSAHAFDAPALAPDPDGTMWTALAEAPGLEVKRVVEKAETGWSLRSQVQADDLSPLQGALGLAAAALGSQGGLGVVDRSAGISYAADDFVERANALNDDGDLTFCDHVRLERQTANGALALRTHGMKKFGHRDLALRELDPRFDAFGVWLVCQALGGYAALQRPLEPGQNFAYTRADPAAKLFFDVDADGLLVITDCHATEKRAVPGLRRCITTLFPTFLVQHHDLTSEDAEDESSKDEQPTIASVDDYADFTRRLHDGDVRGAFQAWNVGWGTLASFTYEWTKKLTDPELAAALEKKLWGP